MDEILSSLDMEFLLKVWSLYMKNWQNHIFNPQKNHEKNTQRTRKYIHKSQIWPKIAKQYHKQNDVPILCCFVCNYM